MDILNGIPQIPVDDIPHDAVLLDVRERVEFIAGHAPGAINVPMSELQARLVEVPRGEDALLVICRSGVRSQKVAEFLATRDVPAINVLGGTVAWQQTGHPLVSDNDEEPAVVAPPTSPPPTGP
ncbi:MAG TPA: rhodanese-like domain-containing protein [Propionibacteriaceae bacterium]|nr:rhodanese-like domain-containing protein [Propionibacteriaceae bacterium]